VVVIESEREMAFEMMREDLDLEVVMREEEEGFVVVVGIQKAGEEVIEVEYINNGSSDGRDKMIIEVGGEIDLEEEVVVVDSEMVLEVVDGIEALQNGDECGE